MNTNIYFLVLIICQSSTFTRSAQFHEGQLECHCDDPGEVCNELTGACISGCGRAQTGDTYCEIDWTGPACQIGNVARGKSAQQSGNYPDDNGNGSATNAVDGRKSSSSTHYCSHTDIDINPAYWIVDLDGLHIIIAAIIYNRNDQRQRLADTVIGVGNGTDIDNHVTCATIGSGREQVIVNKTCNGPIFGSHVSLRRLVLGEQSNIINLCEVIVVGYKHIDCQDGGYGVACLQNCYEKCTSCDPITGSCMSNCIAGYTGQECQDECPVGRWGDGCLNVCTSHHCLNGDSVCAHVDGHCIDGCQDGWRGSTCTERIPDTSTQAPLPTSTMPVMSHPETRANRITTTKEPRTPIGGIIGGVVGGIAFIVAIIVLVGVLFIRFRKNPEDPPTKDHNGNRTRPEIVIINSQPLINGGEHNEAYDTTLDNADATSEQKTTPTAIVKPVRQAEYSNVITPVKPPTPPKPVERYDSVPVTELTAYVEKHKCDTNGFSKEFKSLPDEPTSPWLVGHADINKKRNRFQNIRAYDATRVILKNQPENATSDYINASYIGGYNDPDKNMYIAAQGPLETTVADFWHMIWHEGTTIVIMLTKSIESGKKICESYWPEDECDGAPMVVGDITVSVVDRISVSDIDIRTLNAKYKGESRLIHHLHFTGWPDQGVPQFATALLNFRRRFRSHMSTRQGPVIVHCSAGVGRTGTFIAIDSLLEQAAEEQIVDVHGFSLAMRENRFNMIQTLRQYTFVYDALLEALLSGETAIPASKFESAFTEMESSKAKLSDQFEILAVLRPIKKDEAISGLDNENKMKNRDLSVVPVNRVRPFLTIRIPKTNDYVSAAYVDGFKEKNAYILTQMPLQDTIPDMWRLMFEHQSSSIIMLEEMPSSDPTCPIYWPDDAGSPMEMGPLLVKLVAITDLSNNITIRDFKIIHTSNVQTQMKVKQFHVTCWPSETTWSDAAMVLCDVLDHVMKWQQKTGNKSITIQCMNGVMRSGVLCVLSYVLEKLKLDQEVDVFNATKHVRINSPYAIENVEQYEFLHELVLKYMKHYGQYANFQ